MHQTIDFLVHVVGRRDHLGIGLIGALRHDQVDELRDHRNIGLLLVSLQDGAQAFLAADAVLILGRNVAGGLLVYPRVIAANLRAELPFLATENILMAGVAAGGDRQDLHERIRRHSRAAAAVVKQEGRANDLLERLAADPAFAQIDLSAVLDPLQLAGRAPRQVDEFLTELVEPLLAQYPPPPDDAEVSV